MSTALRVLHKDGRKADTSANWHMSTALRVLHKDGRKADTSANWHMSTARRVLHKGGKNTDTSSKWHMSTARRVLHKGGKNTDTSSKWHVSTARRVHHKYCRKADTSSKWHTSSPLVACCTRTAGRLTHIQQCRCKTARGAAAARRHLASSGVDVYTAVGGGVGALYGPLHGGANEAVLRMLARIKTVDNIPAFIAGVKNRKEKLFGFGHRCPPSPPLPSSITPRTHR